MDKNINEVEFSKDDLNKIAKQLRCPEGEIGLKIGEQMKKSNINMLVESIVALNLEKKNRILTVNTIYFWEKPVEFLNEMYRVLKPKGVFILTFVKKDFMKTLSFVNDKEFNIFSKYDILELLNQTSFKISNIKDKKETAVSKINTLVNGDYLIVTLTK